MKSVAVLQARTNSSRLPGKVLLPINGIPLVVLAAKRAANTGRNVIVATSRESSDDALALLVKEHGLGCHRGNLENTLDRVVSALSAYDDDTLVFRLTADNVFPDGRLLDEIEDDFLERGLDYLCCNGELSGLPYGVSVELTRLKHLREAAKSSASKYDQEHVTPYVRRKFGEAYFERYKCLGMGHFRCTVDCLDDYLCVQEVFSQCLSPVSVPALELVNLLKGLNYQPVGDKPASKLVLGTAQLGLNYGIANISGKPEPAVAEALIKTAIGNGVAYLDTARAYGNSEETIGAALKSGWEGRVKVITKLSPLSDCPAGATPQTVRAFVDASVYKSCSSLRMQSLDVLMLHRASNLEDWGGEVWARLKELQNEGVVKELGVSVQNPQEIETALAIPEVTFIQMPFNVLDWRWDTVIPKIRATKVERNLVVHVRSGLLQGLLQSDSREHWLKAGVDDPANVIRWLSLQCENNARKSVVDFCLSYISSLDWVDGVAVGVESMPQLIENIEVFCGDKILANQLDQILAGRPRLEAKTLNPALWSKG
ncbi:3-deoxy-manno-octulosonate cytidylyltransferase [compost metagenome]